MVVELLATEAGEVGQFRFPNPRPGWVHCASSVVDIESGSATAVIESAAGRGVEIRHDSNDQSTLESMQYMPEGDLEATLEAVGGTKFSSVRVKAVPEMVYANYPGEPHFKEFGTYDWSFTERSGIASCVNVMITGKPEGWAREWVGKGRRVLQQVGVPGLRQQDQVTPESALQYWRGQDGWGSPLCSGLIADEFLPGREEKIHAWSEGLKHLTEGSDRLFYAYLGGEAAELVPILRAFKDLPCRFAYERYLKEQPTEAAAWDLIRDRMSRQVRQLNEEDPNLLGKLILVLGLLCGPPETLNTNPSVSYKVFLDMQFHHLANDPALEGVYGVETYLSSYADEEYLRWAAKLLRHYCIEGRRCRYTKDPYELRHIKNPDFGPGLSKWELHPAEQGTIAHEVNEGYGWLEGRYPRDDEGDTFLVMKRSRLRPNIVSQRMIGLKPGGAYSVKMFIGDRLELTSKRIHAVSVDCSGADILPELCYHGAIANCYSHHIDRYGDQNTYFNFKRTVFRPRAKSSTLSISDWISQDEPGGPIGQELILNFVEVEPFFSGGLITGY